MPEDWIQQLTGLGSGLLIVFSLVFLIWRNNLPVRKNDDDLRLMMGSLDFLKDYLRQKWGCSFSPEVCCLWSGCFTAHSPEIWAEALAFLVEKEDEVIRSKILLQISHILKQQTKTYRRRFLAGLHGAPSTDGAEMITSCLK